MWEWIVFGIVCFLIVIAIWKQLNGTWNCMFGNHDYEILKESYAPPNNTMTSVRLTSPRDPFTGEILPGITVGERILFGYTTVLLKCPRCKKLRREEMLGKSTTLK